MLQQDSQPLAAVSSELICRIYMHLNMAAVWPCRLCSSIGDSCGCGLCVGSTCVRICVGSTCVRRDTGWLLSFCGALLLVFACLLAAPVLQLAVQAGLRWAGLCWAGSNPNVFAVYARLGACASQPGDHVLVCWCVACCAGVLQPSTQSSFNRLVSVLRQHNWSETALLQATRVGAATGC